MSFQGNYTEGQGGGLYLGGASLVSHCIIAQNITTNIQGGGIYDSSTSVIFDCLIISNTVACPVGLVGVGGGVYSSKQSVYSNCVFASNSATNGNGNGNGGGFYQTGAVTSNDFFNCLFNGNQANLGGGAYIFAGTTSWYNCTFAGNTASSATAGGGGIYFASRDSIKGPVVNCIFYGNQSPDSSNYFVGAAASPIFDHCCAMPSLAAYGGGNMTADPLFWAPTADNFRLARVSPCINAGSNQPWMINTVDLDGHARLDRMCRIVDLGCYEHVPSGALFGIR